MKTIINRKNNVLIALFILLLTIVILMPIGIVPANAEAAITSDEKEVIVAEKVSKEATLSNNISKYKLLYNYDGSPDYLYVEFKEGGYAILANGSNEILEYSPDESIITNLLDESIVYGGPATYYTQTNNTFTDIYSNNKFKMDNQEKCDLSYKTRNTFNISESSNSEIMSNGVIAEKFFEQTLSSNIPSNVPSFDVNDLISPTAGATYIEHAEYFDEDPTHGLNSTNTCTTVATQLMLSYHNYYNDRRIIADEHLNGTQNNNPENNPNYCSDPMLINSQTLGSNQAFHDMLRGRNIIGFLSTSKAPLESYLNERNVSYTIKCIDKNPNVVSSASIIEELDANRPVVMSTGEILNGTANSGNEFNHSVIAYGYQTLTQNDTPYLGYITHFGWTERTNRVWLNSYWIYAFYSLSINHTHNYYKVGAIPNTNRYEYKCNSCGHRTDQAPQNYYLDITSIKKNGGPWNVRVENLTDNTINFYYNSNMCFLGDAQNWTGLSDVKIITLSVRSSKTVSIYEYGFATSIALSYISNGVRYITYADQLNSNGSLRVMYNSKSVQSYRQNNMTVRNLGKNGNLWTIELTNNTGAPRKFYFNSKMCFLSDAQNWTGLSDIAQKELANGESVFLYIMENSTATSIAISYTSGSKRYIFYADNLSTSCTLSSHGSSKNFYSYTKNGMTVSIVGKNGDAWMIELTNNTGSGRTFEYNYKMCFAGDAEKWKSLSHISRVTLGNGETTRSFLYIYENAAATSIAISYLESDTCRKIFYAYDLNKSGTMSAFASTIDPTASSGGCVAEGTLITLADGSQKAVEDLTGDEMLLVWNLETGTNDYAPIFFIDYEQIGHNEVIKLSFSDNTTVDVVYEHGFWNIEQNRYVYLDENATEYIGQSFLKYDGNEFVSVTLTDVQISTEVITVYSPVTYSHMCYYVNGMLSMPGGIEGLFNIFEVNSETMSYDMEAMNADIEEYGLFTYEEFSEIYQIPEEVFNAFNGQYLKVAIGKGLITETHIDELIERYSKFF